MKKIIISLLIGIMLVSNINPVYAQNPGKKLMRGVVNIITGWMELPKNVYEISLEDNIVSGITVGVVKGCGMAIVRTSAGAYEVATFPFAIPEDYVPILDPAYVFDIE